jgi:DNA-binding protein Fis
MGWEYHLCHALREGPLVATHFATRQQSGPAHDIFYVVSQAAPAPLVAMVTVLHEVPAGAHELASFENPNGAIDYAESTVRGLQASGVVIEFVDPPSGLIGTGWWACQRLAEHRGTTPVAKSKQLPREYIETGEVVTIRVGMTFDEVEKLLITATVQHTDGNISESARILGIDRATLYQKVKRYGIPR